MNSAEAALAGVTIRGDKVPRRFGRRTWCDRTRELFSAVNHGSVCCAR